MGKPMYVTLDALVFSDNAEEDTRLIRGVDENYKSRTFAELLERMVDGNPDEYNKEPYTAKERQIAAHVNDLLKQANTNPGSVQLYALSKDEPPQEINVNLNDKVADYNDRMLKVKTISGPSGEEQKYQHIELTISDNTAGGLYGKLNGGLLEKVVRGIYEKNNDLSLI